MTTDITDQTQREKFEAWLSEKPLHARYMHWSNTLNAYDYTGIQLAWEAYQAGGAELAGTLEKAQRYIDELREWNAGLAQESFERQQRISELLEGKVGNALLERENHHVEVVGKLTELIDQLEARTVEMPKRSLGFPHGYLLMPFPYYDAEEVEKALEDAGVKWSAKR